MNSHSASVVALRNRPRAQAEQSSQPKPLRKRERGREREQEQKRERERGSERERGREGGRESQPSRHSKRCSLRTAPAGRGGGARTMRNDPNDAERAERCGTTRTMRHDPNDAASEALSRTESQGPLISGRRAAGKAGGRCDDAAGLGNRFGRGPRGGARLQSYLALVDTTLIMSSPAAGTGSARSMHGARSEKQAA